MHLPHPALECFEFWLCMEGMDSYKGQIRTGLCRKGKVANPRVETEGKGTHDYPGPVVHQLGDVLIHLLLLLLQVRDEARKILLGAMCHGPVNG